MEKVIGFVNLHHSLELGALTESRSIASTPFLGRYAFVDFTLSNFCNSGIDMVGILVKKNQRSLVKHLGNSNAWNINTKQGTNTILYNERENRDSLYNNDVNNILTNDWFLKKYHADYIVVAPSHFVMSINYHDIIKKHREHKAGITVVYQAVSNAKTHFAHCDVVMVENGVVTNLKRNSGTKDNVNISLETYIISADKFEELIYKTSKVSALYNMRDLIAYLVKKEKVYAHEHVGYVRCFDSLHHYMNYSLELLDYKKRQQLFVEKWPIFTVTNDTPPTKYLENADVKNSFISNGAIIDGTVHNSILSRNVVVKKGARVINSIILTDCVIAEDCHLENVIVDKYAKIIHCKDIKGTVDQPMFIKQGDVI